MANRAKKNNKKLIIGICSAIAVVVIIAVIAIVATRNGGLNDNYFKSDDTKYVLTIETDSLETDDDAQEYMPIKTHIVYTYEGDNITGMKTYAEYPDAETAKKSFDALKESDDESLKDAELNGKYIVITNSEDQYEGMTASEVKQQIEFMEMLKNTNSDDGSETEETNETESAEE